MGTRSRGARRPDGPAGKEPDTLHLNVLTSAISQYCAAHVLDEKVVLAPSRRVGAQWLDAVARSGQPVLNARVETLRHVALELAGPQLEGRGLRHLRGLRLEVLVDGVVRSLLEGDGGDGTDSAYLAGLVPSPGLTRTIARAIRELRLAGLDSKDVDPGDFEVERKGAEIHRALADFESLLQEKDYADYPLVAKLAIDRLAVDPFLAGRVSFLAPEEMVADLSGLERLLWDSIPEGNRVVLLCDRPCAAPEGEAMTDSMLLRWAQEPAAAPEPAGDGTVRFISAIGEVNEVREVLRSCVQREIPLDRVEVVCTQAETYVPHFYELAVRLLREGSEDLPVTFADGIPARYARPGRALAAWLAWAAEDYSQQQFVRMIRDGIVEVPGARARGFSFARLAAIMRTVPVGAGLPRYAEQLGKAASKMRGRFEAHAGRADDDEGGPPPDKLDRMRERCEGLEMLRDMMSDITDNAPATAAAGALPLLGQARYFLENITRSVSKFDAYALEALLEQIDELTECIGEIGGGGFEALDWLADLPASVMVGGQGPRPGCLHVSSLQQGGNSGRPCTFIIGMDDTRFPGAGLQDALLLDSERAAISAELSTAARRIDLKVLGFARLVARLRGEVVLTWCSRSLTDDREMFPSRVLISASRAVSGGKAAAITDSRPASFAPAGEKGCLDMTEWWLWRMCAGEHVLDPQGVIGENFHNLSCGFEALEARASDEFTEYDGYVPEAGSDNDCTAPGGPVMSPSRLGSLAANPMEYFFQNILKVRPPEEFEADPSRWLDPLEQGTLLHAVFCDFIRGLQARGELPPVFDRDRSALVEILDEYIEEKKAEKPPPTDPTVFANECRALRNTAESFLQMEAEFCAGAEPVACELAVGVEPDGEGTEYDMDEAVEVALPDGSAVRIRCKLDRVDRLPGEAGDEYVVCDYKTGKSDKYRQNGPFYQGRFMQAALYPLAGEAALRRRHGAAKVVRFEYVFPRPSESARVQWRTSGLAAGMSTLALLCDMIASGCFAFTNNPDDAKYSDYKAAFGNIASSVEDIDRKLTNPENTALAPYRALREVVIGSPEESA